MSIFRKRGVILFLLTGLFLVASNAWAVHPMNQAVAPDAKVPVVGGSVISNGLIKLAVNPEGHLNIPGIGPPSLYIGTDAVGLRLIYPTGGESEATAPGCLCEGWGASADAVSGYASVDNPGGIVNITPGSFIDTGDSVVSEVDIGTALRVTHDYHPSTDTLNLYEVTVTLTNISGGDIADLRYRRVMDWDIGPTTFDEFVTIDSGTAVDLVLVTDNGFDSPDPLSIPDLGGGTYTVGDRVDDGPDDHGAFFQFEFGALADGESKVFTIYYGAAFNEPDALAALAAVGAEAFSFGQPNTDPPADHGEPNTFIFAFGGVGGEPIFGLDKELTSGPDRDGAVWFDDFSSTDGLTLNGNAATSGLALRLVPATFSQSGSAFTTSPVVFGPNASFNTHFSFQISASGGGGADGLTFTIQNDPAADTALGGGGGAMGYTGITNSLTVEFDSWFNGPGAGDPDANHVGTATNGVLGSGTAVSLGAPALDSGTVFYAWIDYDGVADQLEVRLDTVDVKPAAPTLSEAGIGLAALIGGPSAHVGFTAATGGAFGNHDILSWHFGTKAAEYIDLVVPIGVLVPTAYDFTITWNGDTPVWIYDTVPAEWDVTDIEFDDTGLPLGCGEETEFDGDYGMVDVWRGGKAGKKCQSDTDLRWMPGDDNTLNVQTLARCHDNKKNKKCKPTSCGALYLNYGAVAFEKDPDTGELVLDENGDPIVVDGPTDDICLAAVDDIDGDGTFTWDGSGDEDGDDLSDYEEACGIGTDPCLADTDGDGIDDDEDACPLNGDEGLGIDASGCPIRSCTMVDNFAYQWNLLLEGDGTVAAGSTIDFAYPTGTASGSLNPEGAVDLTATNDAPDGCTLFTDSFEYGGSCAAGVCGGPWQSYCSGSPVTSGSWDGTLSGNCELSNPEAAAAASAPIVAGDSGGSPALVQ